MIDDEPLFLFSFDMGLEGVLAFGAGAGLKVVFTWLDPLNMPICARGSFVLIRSSSVFRFSLFGGKMAEGELPFSVDGDLGGLAALFVGDSFLSATDVLGFSTTWASRIFKPITAPHRHRNVQVIAIPSL